MESHGISHPHLCRDRIDNFSISFTSKLSIKRKTKKDLIVPRAQPMSALRVSVKSQQVICSLRDAGESITCSKLPNASTQSGWIWSFFQCREISSKAAYVCRSE